MTLTDEPLLAELERLRYENAKLRAQVRRESVAAIKRKRMKAGGRLRHKPYRYPIPTMKVGQSFFVPSQEARHRLRSLCCYWQRKQGKRFSVLAHESDGVKGWRVVRWE